MLTLAVKGCGLWQWLARLSAASDIGAVLSRPSISTAAAFTSPVSTASPYRSMNDVLVPTVATASLANSVATKSLFGTDEDGTGSTPTSATAPWTPPPAAARAGNRLPPRLLLPGARVR